MFNIKWDDCCDSIREYYIYKLNITIYKKKRWKYELLQTTSISEEERIIYPLYLNKSIREHKPEEMFKDFPELEDFVLNKITVN